MAKKKKVDDVEEVNEEVSGEIAEMIDYVRDHYQVPDDVKTVFVTVSKDGNKQVFYKNNAATLYAKQSKDKLYSIKWD